MGSVMGHVSLQVAQWNRKRVSHSVLLNGSHYFHVVSCPLSHDPRGGGAARCRVKAAERHTASPHKVFVTF